MIQKGTVPNCTIFEFASDFYEEKMEIVVL